MKTKVVIFQGQKKVEIKELEIRDPQDYEVQARTLVNGICKWESFLYKLDNITDFFNPDFPAYLNKPKNVIIPGHEGIGIVTKVGKSLKGINKGDYITTLEWSEYTNQKEGSFIKLNNRPKNVKEYLIEPLSCAVTAASYLNIYPGDKIIIFGAGYMGLLLIQLLSKYPITELVVVDLKRLNLNLAKEFGATRTYNLSIGKDSEILKSKYRNYFDISYECSGTKYALDLCTSFTKNGGKIGIYSWIHENAPVNLSSWHLKGLHVLNLSPSITTDEIKMKKFESAERLLNSGIINQKKLITHEYKLDKVKKAMSEILNCKEGFIKSVLTFSNFDSKEI